MVIVASVLFFGWFLAATLGTWAYLAGDTPHSLSGSN